MAPLQMHLPPYTHERAPSRPLRARPARPARGLAAAACALTLAAVGGCRSPLSGEPAQATGTSSLTREQLRDVLSQGTIRPVESLEGEDPFREAELAQGEFSDPEQVLDELTREIDAQAALAVEASLPPQNPYLTFGERIKVYPDGTITKPYPLRVGTGERMKELIQAYGNFPMWSAELGEASTVDMVKLENLPGWDVELYQDLRNPVQAQGQEQQLADWLVITSGYDLLLEVEDFINLFAAGVPQIEIEAKIVEITFTDTLDLGVETSVDWPDKTFVQGVNNTTPNSAGGIGGLLSLAAVQDGITYNVMLQALSSKENVSIISQPKIAVREGGRADILNTTRLPFIDVTSINNTGGFNAKINFLETGVKLYVVPRVVGTQTVALNIDVEASQQSGSQVTLISSDEEVTVPIVSTRAAHTVVYLQPGQAVVLGGLISERSVDRVRKTPLLGDIPILGSLFRSKFTSKEQTNVLFFIRPRILQGTDLNRDF